MVKKANLKQGKNVIIEIFYQPVFLFLIVFNIVSFLWLLNRNVTYFTYTVQLKKQNNDILKDVYAS